jgi:EAL domain-containing protein (putative c-di-GMP-specific phosphodiesterase class I)
LPLSVVRSAARGFAVPAAAAALLLALSVARFVFPDVSGVMLFAILPITLLGMTLGVRGGLGSAVVASGVAIVWDATNGDQSVLDYVNEPVTFLVLGVICGYFAGGALGEYDLRQALARAELRQGIAAGELVMHYQPVVNGADGEIVLVEALARWAHPDRGLIAPVDFIPLAEGDERTIRELTLCTMSLACTDALARIEDGRICIAVNLSPAVFSRPGLAAEIARVLAETGMPAARLVVEVTESAIASDDRIAPVLGEIREIGVRAVAIDDFGVGHSSLARLGDLPVDMLKIDRELIQNLGAPATSAIVAGIVTMAHGLGLEVIAEGVEDAATATALAALGCNAQQGFHYSRPLPPGALAGWLARAAPPVRR